MMFNKKIIWSTIPISILSTMQVLLGVETNKPIETAAIHNQISEAMFTINNVWMMVAIF